MPVGTTTAELGLAFWLGLFVLLGSACGAGKSEPKARNLLFISVDTLRADRLGCYGYERGTTPNLDRLAAEGALFLQATAPSPWTLPSHASMFTGLSPKRHGAKGLKRVLLPEAETLAEILGERGFQTHAIVSSTVLQGSGLERGFQSLALVDQGGPQPSAVSAACIQLLDELDPTRPFFLLAHYIDPHTDYGSEEPFRSRFLEPYSGIATGIGQQLYRAVSGNLELSAEDVRHLSNLYDGGVAQVDTQVELLLEHLRSLGLWEDTLVLLTSDHGEEFLDHGGLMHGFNHHEEMIRVPLLLVGPGIPLGFESSVPVSLMDILPTCLGQLGVAAPQELEGLDLSRLWQPGGAELPERAFYYEADWDAPLPGNRSLSKGSDRALRVGRYKLHLNLQNDQVQLYDLGLDPHETHDLSAESPEVRRALEAELRRYLGDSSAAEQKLPEPELSAAELKDLIRLGYAGEDADE